MPWSHASSALNQTSNGNGCCARVRPRTNDRLSHSSQRTVSACSASSRQWVTVRRVDQVEHRGRIGCSPMSARLVAELTYECLGRQRESFRHLGVSCQGYHALAHMPMLPSLGYRKGLGTILCSLLMLLLLLFVFVIKREIERSREHAIGTVVIENGVHRVLRDNTKSNRWLSRRDNSDGGLTGNRATGS